jgi:leucyl aminopeptidase
MKLDMGGAAAVVGLMKVLAGRKAKANVVGIVALAENTPSHLAYRPSDVIDSMSGKTIEILNTDAEGRLVLADSMTYVQRTYKPQLMIDLATLTGAMMVALGTEYCGTFVNNDELWQNMEAASKDSGEKLWRMPLDPVFKKDMEGKISDLQNMGNMGRYAGACTAAGFLEHFVENDCPWAHMDIAGTAWIKSDKATAPKPATGFGVRILNQMIANSYEGK